MANLSKYFNEIIVTNKITCGQLLHPNDTCVRAWIKNLPSFLWGTSEFFLPIYFLPLLANPKRVTRKKINDILLRFLNSVQTAFLTAAISILSFCQLHNLRGKISYATAIRIPAMIGGFSICLANDNVRLLFGHTTITIISEILIRDGSFWPLKFIRNSNTIRTLLFMSLSAFILDTLRVMDCEIFWFVQPIRVEVIAESLDNLQLDDERCWVNKIMRSEKHVCQHNNNCDSYILQTLKSYLGLGLAVTSAKSIFSHFGLICRNPLTGILQAAKRINFNFLIFIAGYPSLYRLVNCVLNRYFQQSCRISHSIAGFVGAIPFWFYASELPIIGHAIACTIELTWTRYLCCIDRDSKLFEYLTKIPFASLVYIFGGAFMYNIRVFYPWLAPKFLFRLVELLTNRKFDDISQRFHAHWIPRIL